MIRLVKIMMIMASAAPRQGALPEARPRDCSPGAATEHQTPYHPPRFSVLQQV